MIKQEGFYRGLMVFGLKNSIRAAKFCLALAVGPGGTVTLRIASVRARQSPGLPLSPWSNPRKENIQQGDTENTEGSRGRLFGLNWECELSILRNSRAPGSLDADLNMFGGSFGSIRSTGWRQTVIRPAEDRLSNLASGSWSSHCESRHAASLLIVA